MKRATLAMIAGSVFVVWLLGAAQPGAQAQQAQAAKPAQPAARVIRFTPKDLGTFPDAEDQSRYPAHNASEVRVRNRLIDPDFPPGATAQTYRCDFTGNGKLDYMVGGAGGRFIFTRHDDGTWTRYQIRADRGPTDVGAVALDLTGDGLCDVITGTQWLRNPGFADGDFRWPNPQDRENGWQWEAFSIAEGLAGPHDQILADLTGDGRMEMLYYQDGPNGGLRWFQISEDPTKEWVGRVITIPTTHTGLAPAGAGDIDGDGRIDVAIGYMWFQNLRVLVPPGRSSGSGTASPRSTPFRWGGWRAYRDGPATCMGPRPGSRISISMGATISSSPTPSTSVAGSSGWRTWARNVDWCDGIATWSPAGCSARMRRAAGSTMAVPSGVFTACAWETSPETAGRTSSRSSRTGIVRAAGPARPAQGVPLGEPRHRLRRLRRLCRAHDLGREPGRRARDGVRRPDW